MANLISFRSKNIINNGYNNSLRYELPGSSINFKDAEVAVHSIQIYNSQFNIDSDAYANNTFSIEVPTAATTSTVNITLNNGYYSYTDINRSIQAALVSEGAYLINADGDNVFYFQLTENSAYYAAQVDLAATPTALPSGYTRPATGLYSSGGSGLPTTTRVPRLIISNAAFGKIIGFSTGTYPAAPQTTAASILSNITPQINPVSSYMLRCSLINNPYSIPSDVITSFSIQGTTAGQLIDYKPNEYLWLNVSDATYSAITLTIVDQEERFPKFNDTDVLIMLAIRQKK
jgi:hypothetical protein